MLTLLMRGRHGSGMDYVHHEFQNEVVLDTYTSLLAALGLTGSKASNAFLRYHNTVDDVYYVMPKTVLTQGLTFNALMDAGLVTGKTITWNGRQYLARLIRGTGQGYSGNLPPTADMTNYTAASIYANSEFNHLFVPIISRPGETSVDGIAYGTRASFTTAALGFGSGNGNSTICAEFGSSQMAMRGSSTERWAGQRGRTTSSQYWGLRPILMEV